MDSNQNLTKPTLNKPYAQHLIYTGIVFYNTLALTSIHYLQIIKTHPVIRYFITFQL